MGERKKDALRVGFDGQIRLEVDATVVSPLHCQSGTIATVRVGLQSGQFSVETGVTEACKALVTDDTA